MEMRVIDCIIPDGLAAGRHSGRVYTDDGGFEKGAPFSLLVYHRNSVVVPSQGSCAGRSVVTLVVYWGMQAALQDLEITFAQARGIVVSVVQSNRTQMTVRVMSPPAATAGAVQGVLRATTGQQAVFSYTYLPIMTVSSIQPHVATLDGYVGKCARCRVYDDGYTVSLILRNVPFPVISTLFTVSVGDTACDGSNCRLLHVQDMGETQELVLSLPPATRVGRVNVRVEYAGMSPSWQADSEAADLYLTYTAARAHVQSLQYCASKTSAAVSSNHINCSMWVSEIDEDDDDVVPLVAMPIQAEGGGLLTVTILNAPYLGRRGSGAISVMIAGQFARIQRVFWWDDKSLRFECVTTSYLHPQHATALVTLQRQDGGGDVVQVEFQITLYDATRVLSCASATGSTHCSSSSQGDPILSISVTNLPIFTAQEALHGLRVVIGDKVASGVHLLTSRQQSTVFTITVPSCERYCRYVRGRSLVQLKVQVFDSTSQDWQTVAIAMQHFTYHAAPILLSAAFSTAGSGVVLTFDQPTNRMGRGSHASFMCGALLPEPQRFGEGVECLWQTSDRLLISFGASSAVTLALGDIIQLNPGLVRSENIVSAFAPSPLQPAVLVQAPSFPRRPGPVLIKGPSEIDVCGTLMLQAAVASPRPANYLWCCTNDAALDGHLKLLNTRTIQLRQGTPEMARVGYTYHITLTVTDFLGLSSGTAEHMITKKSAPSPLVVFEASNTYTYTQPEPLTVLIRAQPEFSACAASVRSQLMFNWSLLSWPQDTNTSAKTRFESSALSSSSAHVYLPPGTLAAGAYVLGLTVFSATDASYRSSAVVLVQVTAAPLLAVIAGGSWRSVSSQQSFVLSSRGSRDLGMATNVSQGLAYVWRCSMSSMPCRDKTHALLQLPTSSQLVIPAGRLAASHIAYEFSLTVSKDTRLARTSVSVSVSELNIPLIQLEQNFTTRDTEGRVKINCFSLQRLLFQAESRFARQLNYIFNPPFLCKHRCQHTISM